jgi:hypothetical protein
MSVFTANGGPVKNRAILFGFLAAVVGISPVMAMGASQSKGSNKFVYPKGYSELSKKRVDQLRKIHYVFDTICSESFASASERDQIVEAFEGMCVKGKMRGTFFVYLAEWSIEQVILDPAERAHAKEAIKHAIDKFHPLDDQLNA